MSGHIIPASQFNWPVTPLSNFFSSWSTLISLLVSLSFGMVIGCIVLAKMFWFTVIELSGFCFTSMPICLNILQFTEPISKTLHSLSMTLTLKLWVPPQIMSSTKHIKVPTRVPSENQQNKAASRSLGPDVNLMSSSLTCKYHCLGASARP